MERAADRRESVYNHHTNGTPQCLLYVLNDWQTAPGPDDDHCQSYELHCDCLLCARRLACGRCSCSPCVCLDDALPEADRSCRSVSLAVSPHHRNRVPVSRLPKSAVHSTIRTSRQATGVNVDCWIQEYRLLTRGAYSLTVLLRTNELVT